MRRAASRKRSNTVFGDGYHRRQMNNLSFLNQPMRLEMNRRSALRKSVGATVAAGAAAISAPAISQGKIEWRMVTTWPKNFPGLGVGAENLAKRINTMSGGRLTIKVFAAGEMVPPLQALDAVINGSAEMSHGASYYWQNKSPGLSFFTGVPYGMTSRELGAWVRYLGGQQIWDEIYHQFGVQGFLSGDTGTQAGGWFRKELKSLEDVKGLRFRTPGLGGQVWAKLGASVTNMAAGEIFQALQSGTLDASLKRAWPPKRLSTRRNSSRCPPICRKLFAPPARPSTTALPVTLLPMTRVRCRPCWPNTACRRVSSRPTFSKPVPRRLVKSSRTCAKATMH